LQGTVKLKWSLFFAAGLPDLPFGIATGGNRNKLIAQPDVGWIGLVPRMPGRRNGEPARLEGQFVSIETVAEAI
jgi:hypothetical protein